MKIVSWNCNGALRRKWRSVEALKADICIVQECEDPSQTNDEAYLGWASNHLWKGNNKNKGIGIFVRPGIELTPLDWPSEDLELFLPCQIDNSFNLLAVWTKQASSPTFEYIGQGEE